MVKALTEKGHETSENNSTDTIQEKANEATPLRPAGKFRLKTFTIAAAKMYFTPGYGTQGSNVLEANKPVWNYIVQEAFIPSYTTGYDTAPGWYISNTKDIGRTRNSRYRIS